MGNSRFPEIGRERESVSDREIDIQYTTSHFSNENDLGTNVLIKDQFSGHGKR